MTGLSGLYNISIGISLTILLLTDLKLDKPTRWIRLIGSFAGVIVLAVFLAIPTLAIISKNYKVQAANELSTQQITLLKKSKIVLDVGRLEYFYNDGYFSILDGGYLLTENELIYYFTDLEIDSDKKSLRIFSIPIKQITEVVLITDNNWKYFRQNTYKVITRKADVWLELKLPSWEDGDKKFVNALKKLIANNINI